jgi:putative membrane protein
MRFLSTVFWALVAAIAALFSWVNWSPVSLHLWNDLQADIKLPLLLIIVFLLGFLPTWLIMRARIWQLRRRMDSIERQRISSSPHHLTGENSEPVT